MDANSKNNLSLAVAGLGIFALSRACWRRATRYDLRGKTVLITGGSRGLGLLLAREFGRHGARIAICARDQQELSRAEHDLRQRGIEVIALVCDVTDRQQVNQAIQLAVRHWGRIDVLVNNAGTIQAGPMEVMTAEDYDEAMKTHFWAPLYSTLAVLPQMRGRRDGRIVNISSIGGKISVPHMLPYSASKFALVGFSEGLRSELAKDGVVVTTVCPGLMRTGSPRNAYFKGRHRAEYAWFSISGSLPGSSMNADRAARQIVSACRHGDAEVVLSFPAKLAVTFHGLFPGLTSDVLGLVNRVLPGPGGIGAERRRGAESTSAWSPSILTALTERAAAQNNELAR